MQPYRGNERGQPNRIWSTHWYKPHTESQGICYCNHCRPNQPHHSTAHPSSSLERYHTSDPDQMPSSMMPVSNWALQPESYPESNLTSNTPSHMTSFRPVEPLANTMTYPAAELASPLTDSSAASSAVELETHLGANRASYSMYPTARPRPRANILRSRHNQRAIHFSSYVNPERNEYPRNVGVRVPAVYVCQQHNSDSNVCCPISCIRSRQNVTCLFASNITGQPLHITYNWLVSLFARYPGFRDLHITPRHTGAVVGFNNDYDAEVARLALDGFWVTAQCKLKVVLVDPEIYENLDYADYNPQYFYTNP